MIVVAVAGGLLLWALWRLQVQWWAYRVRSQRVRAGYVDSVGYREMWRE